MADKEKNEVKVAFSDQLSDKLISVEAALPKDFNKARFVQNCLAVMNEKPELARMNKAEVIQGLLKGAYLGLDFANKECYLIPYGNSVNFQTDYKGECKFVKRYSIRPIVDIDAKLVREGDTFSAEIVEGKPTINFKPLPFNNNDIVGAFAYVSYKDGGMMYETMSTEEINATRNNYSKQANGSTWKKSWGEMAKKTVLRRLCKLIETDFESTEARYAWEDGGDLDKNIISKPVETDIVENPFTAEVIEEDGSVTTEVIDDLPDFLKESE